MTPLEFEAANQPLWSELEGLLDGAERKLDPDRFLQLYHVCCEHLALAQARGLPLHLIERLAAVTSRAHQIAYRQGDAGVRRVIRSLLEDFPAMVRKHSAYVALAAALFVAPTIALGLAVYLKPDLILSVVDRHTAAAFAQMYSPAAQSIGRPHGIASDWMMFGFYIKNNIGIAFQCYATGVVFGLGSLFFLVSNGAFGGAVAGYIASLGFGGTFFPFVATHSAFELTAIVLCGAAGLRIGRSVLLPGQLTRTAALELAARETSLIVFGAAVMLLIAAVIEAFWSSAAWVTPTAKFCLAAFCWILVLSFFYGAVMQPESAGVVWRTRTTWEGADLGIRLLQCWLKPVFLLHLSVAVPLFVLYATLGGLVSWLPGLLIWLSKPWLDRTILFGLSRALFGVSSSPTDLWLARAEVWWSQLISTLTLRRLSASRSFTQPVLQLEGLRGAPLRARVTQIAARHRGVARAMTQCFALAEFGLFAGLFFLQVWLAPHRSVDPWSDFGLLTAPHQAGLATVEYAAVVLFLEPFYVAAGFGMYLNRRVELEAWDIEQEFRHAFA